MNASVASVVVATRDRPVALERCLTALSWQTLRPLEIVVVDDGSADAEAIRLAVARALPAAGGNAGSGGVRILTADGRGPAAARNLGARAARGEVVCFTDDDCMPVPRWAEHIVAACADGGAAAGPTIADPAAGRAAAASQLITSTLQMTSLADGGVLGFAPSCNLACRADVLRAVPFDETFRLAAGEDRDWCSRLRAAGIELRFVPDATVEHRPSMGVAGLVRQQVRYGQGAVRYRAAGEGRKLSGAAFYARLAREGLRAGPRVAGLVALAQAAVAAGALREIARR